MKRKTIKRFEGGPLAGIEMMKTRPARISTYLADDGETTIRVEVGDKVRSGRLAGLNLYALDSQSTDDAENRVITYKFLGGN